MVTGPFIIAIVVVIVLFSTLLIGVIVGSKLGFIPSRMRTLAIAGVAVLEALVLGGLIAFFFRAQKPAPPAGSQANPEKSMMVAFSFDHVGDEGHSCTHKNV